MCNLVAELRDIMEDTKVELNNLYALMDEQYDVILDKDIIKMSELDKSITSVTKNIANLEFKRRSLIGNDKNLNDVLKELDNKELYELQKEIEVIIGMLQIQRDSNMKLLKQLLYFSNKMINAIKPVDSYGTYNSKGLVK